MKRRDAFRKIRTVCERLDSIDLDEFPIWPIKLFIFGSVLTTKPDPDDIDLAFVYIENPKIEYSDEEFDRMMFYEPRLQPHNKASVELRRGMKKLQLYMVPQAIENWEYMLFFRNGEGLRLIWTPNHDWVTVLEEIESNPSIWAGPRSEDFAQRTIDELIALSQPEKEDLKATILVAIEAQERGIAYRKSITKEQ